MTKLASMFCNQVSKKDKCEKCRELQRNAEKCKEIQRNAEKCRETKINEDKCRNIIFDTKVLPGSVL